MEHGYCCVRLWCGFSDEGSVTEGVIRVGYSRRKCNWGNRKGLNDSARGGGGFGAKPGFLLYRQLYSLPHAQCGVWRRDLELRDPQTQPQDSGDDDESCTKEEDTAHRR